MWQIKLARRLFAVWRGSHVKLVPHGRCRLHSGADLASMNRIHTQTMANREELGIIRGARAGDADCQLALGKLYLFGGAGLPLNVPTALHWLHRAALQQRAEAWRLIGAHSPCEIARDKLPEVLGWYERQWGFFLLEFVWALVSLWSMYGTVRGREPSAASHCAERTA